MAGHLPRDSATMLAALPRQEIEAWDANSYLLAELADLVAVGNWQRGGGKGKRPEPRKRPKSELGTSTPTKESIDEFKQWYSAQPGGRPLDN